jgi:hypothetical protein
LGLFRVALALIIVVVVALVFVRVVVPYLRRITGQTSAPTVVQGSVEASPPGTLPKARWHGYDADDVDGLLDRVYALAATPNGRGEALEQIRSTRFHLARRGGYEPVFVDDLMDSLADALTYGRELPPRPGLR